MEYIQDSHDIDIPFPNIHRTGTDIAVDLLKLGYNDVREQYIVDRYLEGHIPSSCRNFFPVEIEFTGGASGLTRRLTIHVAGEYLSLGMDSDYIRCPINPLTAQALADQLGCILPTPLMVDHIWKSADLKIDPLPWGPPYDHSMMSSERIVKHSHKIDLQIEKIGIDPAGKFLAGHKKDVVVHNILETKTKSVAIYGWHNPNGKPIQELYYNACTKTWDPYTGHTNFYKDYSHGIRFVDREVWVKAKDEEEICMDIVDAMIDSELFTAFGKEPQHVWRQPEP